MTTKSKNKFVTTPTNNDQQELNQALDEYNLAIKQVNKVLMLVFPVVSFLLSVMIANFNWQSTVGTFVISLLAFYAVGIYRQNITLWLIILVAYVFTDNYFSYAGQINMNKIPLHLGSLLIFLAIIHVFRPMLDRWFIYSKQKAKNKAS